MAYENLKNIITHYVLFHSTPYNDGVMFSIGYGCRNYKDGRYVLSTDGKINENEAIEILDASLDKTESYLETLVYRDSIGQNKFEALVSLCLNNRLTKDSEIIKAVNANSNDEGIYDLFMGYSYVYGYFSEALANRRACEYNYYKTGKIDFNVKYEYLKNNERKESDAVSYDSKNQIRYTNTNYCGTIVCEGDETTNDSIYADANTYSGIDNKKTNGFFVEEDFKMIYAAIKLHDDEYCRYTGWKYYNCVPAVSDKSRTCGYMFKAELQAKNSSGYYIAGNIYVKILCKPNRYKVIIKLNNDEYGLKEKLNKYSKEFVNLFSAGSLSKNGIYDSFENIISHVNSGFKGTNLFSCIYKYFNGNKRYHRYRRYEFAVGLCDEDYVNEYYNNQYRLVYIPDIYDLADCFGDTGKSRFLMLRSDIGITVFTVDDNVMVGDDRGFSGCHMLQWPKKNKA